MTNEQLPQDLREAFEEIYVSQLNKEDGRLSNLESKLSAVATERNFSLEVITKKYNEYIKSKIADFEKAYLIKYQRSQNWKSKLDHELLHIAKKVNISLIGMSRIFHKYYYKNNLKDDKENLFIKIWNCYKPTYSETGVIIAVLVGSHQLFVSVIDYHIENHQKKINDAYITLQDKNSPNPLRKEKLIFLTTKELPLEGINLENIVLSEISLDNANLKSVTFNGGDLADSSFKEADLSKAKLKHTLLNNAKLKSVNLEEADLTGADLTGADLTGANLTNAILSRAKLTGADLSGANLKAVNLQYANLTDAKNITVKQIQEAKNWNAAIYSDEFRSNDLCNKYGKIHFYPLLEVFTEKEKETKKQKVINDYKENKNLKCFDLSHQKTTPLFPNYKAQDQLKYNSLRGWNLQKSNLTGVNFSGYNLTKADLRGAKLDNITWHGTNLFCTDFRETNLTPSTFSKEEGVKNLSFAIFDNKEIPARCQNYLKKRDQ